MSSLVVYNEHYYDVLNTSELAFLRKKAGKESHVYKRLMRIMIGSAFVVSFGGAWKNISKEGRPWEIITVFSWEHYFSTLCILITLFYVSVRFSRNSGLTKMRKDLEQKIKIVERVIIRKKTFLPHNNTFHFYLNSAQKLSIQVEEHDFNSLSEGDEINIEYSKNAGVYFGYF